MVLTSDQIIEIKNQLKSHVNHLPDDKKAEAISQIESLSPDALEEFVKEQQGKSPKGKDAPQKPVFRMIVDGDIPSAKIDENKSAIAVLDIMPISKAHVVVIPKKKVKDAKLIPAGAFSLAKKIGKKITSVYKASSIEIQTETKFEESIINIIPSYNEKVNINSKRTKSEVKDLQEVARHLKPKPKIEKIKISKKTPAESQVVKLSRRIP